MILPDMPNLAELALLMHEANEEIEIQTRILKARSYDEGQYDDDLAAQTAKYLIGGSEDEIEGINLMTIVLRTIARRVDIAGFKGDDENFTIWVENVWDANEMDVRQGDVHRNSERDGEYFVIVDYDPAMPRPWEPGAVGVPTLNIHERYTSPEVSYGDEVGTGFGCKAHYRNGDKNQSLDMVSKRWVETTWEEEELVARQRMTLYIAKQPLTAARIERYIMDDDGEWQQHTEIRVNADGAEEQETWPVWWTLDGTETGESMPIPVIHFRNEEMTPITKRLWGIQNGMDHAWSSMLGGITLTGHQIFSVFGWYPTTDGKAVKADGTNLIKIAPRSFVGAPDKAPGEASLDTIEPADLDPVLNSMDKIAIYCAFVAGLPINNFIISKSVASSATLRQGEADLVAHVNALWRLFGRSWVKVMLMAAMLDNLWGSGSHPEAPILKPIWKPAETVNIEGRNDEALAQKNTDVPVEYIWRHVWGYDEDQVAEMKLLAASAVTTADNATGDSDAAPGATDVTPMT